MLIGYARVSTQDQNLELQREALTKAECQKVFENKVSGTRADRPGLAKTLKMLREGDTLVVWKLARLGRSVKNLVDLVLAFHRRVLTLSATDPPRVSLASSRIQSGVTRYQHGRFRTGPAVSWHQGTQLH